MAFPHRLGFPFCIVQVACGYIHLHLGFVSDFDIGTQIDILLFLVFYWYWGVVLVLAAFACICMLLLSFIILPFQSQPKHSTELCGKCVECDHSERKSESRCFCGNPRDQPGFPGICQRPCCGTAAADRSANAGRAEYL